MYASASSVKPLPDHLAILELDISFERFAQIAQRRVPSFKTQLGHRQARQQVSSFAWLGGASIRQRGLKIVPRFPKR